MRLFMRDPFARGGVPRHISGVTCDVRNCVYHDGDNYCCADRITVGSAAARNTSETKCATFVSRGDVTKKY